MPIVSPQLDDLRFDLTVEELKRRIPVYAPEWTDHNDSDPGISLIHLFAYLAEQVAYRLNRVPEKNYIALLELLGIRLQPAHAAVTSLALLLNNPETLTGYTLKKGARAKAKVGTPPPTYETDRDIDIVPAEANLLVTTRNPYIYDLLLKDDGSRESPPSTSFKVPNNNSEWLAVAWDGKTPKLKDMPTDPVPIFKQAGQPYLWIGLDYNAVLDAGFRGVRVPLLMQLDDDEQPDLTKDVTCAAAAPAGETPVSVNWLWYYDAAQNAMLPVLGRIDDSTNHLGRSGIVRFSVPLTIGPIPDAIWMDLRPSPTVTPLDACLAMGTTMQAAFPHPLGQLTAHEYRTVLDAGVTALKQEAAAAVPPIGHPLDPALRSKAKAWLRIQLAPLAADGTSPKLRMVSFNSVQATNATTVNNELLGTSDGRPGQQFTLANRNILAGTLMLAIQEDSDPNQPLVSWSEAVSLDAAGPFDSVYELDREAGVITFGDGLHGRIPPLVPNTGSIVALVYRWGGGKSGEVAVGAITALDTAAPGVAGAVNYVAATGGRDAETLDQAKRRARKELSTRSRAVTAGDFAWIALQTPDVRVARAHIIPLRRPLPPGAQAVSPPAAQCGPELPTGPNGIDTRLAPGAVTVVVVPDQLGPEPIPTPSFLRAVCRQLDGYRLVTTEVHVVPPQYCRLCNLIIKVAGKPGYSRSQLQALVETRLGTYLHVLTGGEDGKGSPFGEQLHIADLVAQVYRTEGVDRVEEMSAQFTRTKSNAAPRQGQLVLCPTLPAQFDRVALSPEENVSVDVTKIVLSTVT
jgi:hypothetical protein